MRHTTTLCSLLAAAVLPLSATAQNWQLIEDFDSVDDWSIFAQMDTDAGMIVGPYEPAGTGTDSLFYVESDGYGGENWGDIHVGTPLPTVINAGDSATLYFEVWMEGTSNNWHVHLSDLEAPTTWGQNVFTLRWTFENDPEGILQGHDGSSYVTYAVTDTGFFPAVGAWHKFWMEFTVSDNEAVTPSSWSLYWEDPDGVVHGPMPFLKEGNPTAGGFRRAPEGGLKTLTVSTNTGNPGGNQNQGDLWFMDDFYITPGLHGGVDPMAGPGETYGGYPIDNGWINTDNIGWVYVGDGTSLNGWVYSDASAGMNLGWLYMHPDNMSGSGDWVYIPR